MNQFKFFLVQALRGIRSSLLVHLSAMGAIAVSFFLVGLVYLGFFNLEHITQRWRQGVQVIAFLKTGISPQAKKSIESLLRSCAEVSSFRFISEEDSLRRMQGSLGAQGQMLSEVERTLMPASFEIQLRTGTPRVPKTLLSLLKASPWIEEVNHVGGWVTRLSRFLNMISWGSLFLIFIISLAAAYIMGSTIRLGAYAHRQEIEVLRLVGATNFFIRGPFFLQGILQGLCGALIGWGALFGLYYLCAPWVKGALSALFQTTPLLFIPWTYGLLGVLIAVLLGCMASMFSLRRYLDV